jgi:hypothetical protein
MGLRVSRSACRGQLRLANKGEPTYDGLPGGIRSSPAVYLEESGWKIGDHSTWLWVATNLHETVYTIGTGRGFAEAASILGEDYTGLLGVDSWAPYRRFGKAVLQTCLSHLLHRASEMLGRARGGAVHFPRTVQGILQRALKLRDRREEGTITPHGLRVAAGRLRWQSHACRSPGTGCAHEPLAHRASTGPGPPRDCRLIFSRRPSPFPAVLYSTPERWWSCKQIRMKLRELRPPPPHAR